MPTSEQQQIRVATLEEADAYAFSDAEELWHSLTHGFGAVLGLVGLIALTYKVAEADWSSYWAALTYASALVLVFASSAACHGLSRTRYALWFEMADHIAIFLMIAGTYTPVAVIVLPEPVGSTMLIAMWGTAAAGIAFKVFSYVTGWHERLRTPSVVIYLVTGWIGLWAVEDIAREMAPPAFAWFIAGAALYTIGAGIYSLRRVPLSHLVWHFFVLAAATCHFVAIYSYVV